MPLLKKILYVDDQEDIQTIAKLALEGLAGLTVKLCGSGQQALDEIEDFSPDLILLDVMMPNMSGPQTLTKIRQQIDYQSTPVVFMTAKTQPEEITTYMSQGVLGVIKKPFDPINLADELISLWKQRL